MLFVICKNNSFSKLITGISFNSVFHKLFNNFLYSIFVENKLIDVTWRSFFKIRSSFFFVLVFNCLTVFFTQVIKVNTLINKGCRVFNRIIINEVSGFYSFFVSVVISRVSVFQFKKIKCTSFNFFAWSSGQSYKICIKIIKDSAVLLKNTSVCFINNNQVKMSWSIKSFSIFSFISINGIKNCRIS